MTIKIKKAYVVWTGIILLQILLVAYLQGWFGSSPFVPPTALKMTQKEASLVRSVIALVRDDVAEGKLSSTKSTISALSSLLPSGVKAMVLEELGAPDMGKMLEALDNLERRLPYG